MAHVNMSITGSGSAFMPQVYKIHTFWHTFNILPGIIHWLGEFCNSLQHIVLSRSDMSNVVSYKLLQTEMKFRFQSLKKRVSSISHKTKFEPTSLVRFISAFQKYLGSIGARARSRAPKPVSYVCQTIVECQKL